MSETSMIRASLARCITFASHQCAVAVISDLTVLNPTDTALEGLTLEMVSSPPVLAPRIWKLDHIRAGGEVAVRDRNVSLDGGLLDRLSEKLRADVTFRLLRGEEVLDETTHELTALARNEWGGAGSMPELLAAFVTPNDPGVAEVIKEAAEILRLAGKSPSLDGYQLRSRERVWELAAAIWGAVSARRLVYAEPPASFETNGQKIRLPSDVLGQGLATCLDTALLFAAALEQTGLNALIAFTKGHALAGVWLQPTHLATLTCDDATDLRKHVALKELVLFETTLACNEPPVSFSQAIDQGHRRIREEVEAEFVYALDLRQARARQISPLPIELAQARSAQHSPLIAVGLEEAPSLPGFDFGLFDDAKVDTPEGRLDHWKRKLLDLTKRNRLLNLKPSKTAIRMICPNSALLEDKLASDIKITIIPMEPLGSGRGGRDEAVFQAQTGQDYEREFAASALDRNQLPSALPEAELKANLVELYRKAATDIQEGGANTLFLALGMLRWRVSEKDSQTYRAPLILIPVKLERASASSPPRLSQHPDDPVFNMTLLQMLRQDFELRIPELEGALPEDDAGIDVTKIWTIMRKAVRDVPGFEVTEEIVLSNFSFAKFLMWKDLSDRTDELKQSPFVAHMIDKPREIYGRAPDFLSAEELDEKIHPGELFTPLQADSSQVVAVHASASDGDFVLEGPPGTGKSQTIANIIAHNIGLGRKVLFVAEKMTALNVVYERLKAVGLGDFCLELHSTKANKKAVIDQLDASWRNRVSKPTAIWDAEAARLKSLRDGLNGLVSALHEPGSSGISPRQAVAVGAASKFAPSVVLDWPSDLGTDLAKSREALAALTEASKLLGQAICDLDPEDFDSFAEIEHTNWSFDWSAKIASAAADLVREIDAARKAAASFASNIKLPFEASSLSSIELLGEFASILPLAAKLNLEAALSPDGPDIMERLDLACVDLEAYKSSRTNLSQSYTDAAIASVDFATMQSRWKAAASQFWPIGPLNQWRQKSTARKSLHLEGNPDLNKDLPIIAELQDKLASMRNGLATVPTSAGWLGLDTDPERIRATSKIGRAVRTVTAKLAKDPTQLPELRRLVRILLVDGRELLEPGMPLSQLAEKADTSSRRLTETVKDFGIIAQFSASAGDDLDRLHDLATAIIERTPRLNSWCRWRLRKEQCTQQGLGVLVEALETGAVEHTDAARAFEVAYCRWLAPLLIDSRPVLKRFSAVEHEVLVGQFRALDEKLATLSAGYIRARLSADIPSPDEKQDSKTQLPGFSTLRREVQKQRAHKAVRQLVEEMGPALLRLTPCLMMSPLSVAQFLSAGRDAFDLVIFDEASQITVWDAIGAIARGRNAIIVGDPKQMPPSNFFNRGADGGEDGEDEASGLEDLESILDEGLASGMKLHRLTGHYRSRHESLIAFSNHRYYGSELVTYPSAETRQSAVSFVRCNGAYQKGKERTNPEEAKAIVAEIVRRLNDPELQKLSIGVVTMNSEQQRLIRNLLDEARRNNPGLESFFKDKTGGELETVYNLETVQGHERDVIMLSIGYGPTVPGAPTMSMNFGPLNQKGGQRRWNVAVTRATTEMIVFASFDPDMIDLTRTKAEAVADLKAYLDFARRGPIALAEAVKINGGVDDFDSGFEEAVALALRNRGWQVQTQIGVSKFRIDLGIVHPDAPGRFLAGVECDGASYHSSPTARDRDRVRHAVLERLGWSLVRLWSTDYFLDPKRAIEVVHSKLIALVESDRKQTASVAQEAPEAISMPTPNLTDTPTATEPTVTPPQPQPTNGKTLPLSADRFYDDDYLPILRTLCLELIDQYGPITFGDVAERVARAHSFKRTGSEIQRVIWKAVGSLRQATRCPNSVTTFWPKEMQPSLYVRYRGNTVGGQPREWEHTPHAERLGLALQVLSHPERESDLTRMASRIGLSRLREKTKLDLLQLLDEGKKLMF